MEAIANMLVAAADLAEAEGRELRNGLIRAVIAIGLVIAAMLIGLVGVGFFLYGVFCALALFMPAPAAGVLFGVVLILMAAGILWSARTLTKTK